MMEKGPVPQGFTPYGAEKEQKKILIKNTGADTIETSTPVLADCPPMKGAGTETKKELTAKQGQV